MHERAHKWVRGATWLGLVVAAAGALAYAGSLSGPFIFDDLGSIPDNPHIRRLWPPEYLLRAPVEAAVAGRPVVSLSLAVNHAIDGLDVRGYHLFNVGTHLLCAMLLFGMVRRTLQHSTFAGRYDRSASWLAGATALLWTVHPLQTESVTYIIQRTELLMGLFYLLTLYCAIRGWESAWRRAWFAAAVLACALGMGCKEVMASAPLIVLLYDRTFVNGSFGAALRRHAGLYGGLAATWLVLGALVAAGARRQTVGFDLHIGTLDYLRTQTQVIVWYLRLCFWPDPLVISYGWPVVRAWRECASHGFVVLALLAVTVWSLWRRPVFGFLGAWFFLILAPSSSFIPIVTEIAAERRMYLPLAAVVVAVVLAGRRATGRFAGGALVAVLAVATVYLTTERNRDYRSAIAIWTDAVAKRPDNAQARTNLGVALVNADRSEEALAYCRQALRLESGNYPAMNALGDALAKLGRTDEAVNQYTAALKVRPDYAEASAGLGRTLDKAGLLEEALRHYRRAVELKPDDILCLNNLGDALARQGKTEEAVQFYERALAVRSDYPPAHNNLGNALMTLGRVEEALGHFRRALAIQPDYADALVSYGYALAQIGRLDEAVAQYRKALESQPDNVLCLNNLGNALLNLNRPDEAIATFRRALALDDRRADTHNNLANALVTAGDLPGGVDHYQKAIAIAPDLLPAHYNLAETYRRMQRPAEAKAAYEKAIALAEGTGNTALAERIRQRMAD